MKEEDYDEDIYEETTSKVVYKRRSTSDSKLKGKDGSYDRSYDGSYDASNEESQMEYGKRRDSQIGRSRYSKADISRSEYPKRDRSRLENDQGEWTATATLNLKGRNDKRESKVSQRTVKEESPTRGSDGKPDPRHEDWVRTIRKSRSKSATELLHGKQRPGKADPDFHISPKVEKETRDWLERAKRTGNHEKTRHSRDLNSSSKEKHYTDKWEVDYTNKNYVRSKCMKPQGLHRYVYGRPFEWDIDYDNRYYLESKVNVPKGLHRDTYQFKRKLVPDDDILADATGWQFEYGPEFNQVEGDIPFHPRERIIGKGGYRFYGVRRNNSDCDRKVEEHQELEEIKNIYEEDYKYGHEFLQDDVPHIVEFKDMRIGRGGYRFIDVERNRGDKKPTDVLGLDYRSSRASIDTDVEVEEDLPKKGKPFKQTIFKKTFRLIKPPSVEDFTHGTVLSFIPGSGSKSFFEGKSTRRPSRTKITKHGSKRDVFPSRKKTLSYEKHISRQSGSELNQRRYKVESEKMSSPSRHRSVDEYQRGQKLRHQERKRHQVDDYKGSEERHIEEKRERHRFPPDVQNRIEEIRSITKDVSQGRNTQGWKKHEHHPYDTGKSVTEGYEKYINKRGSEIWIKTEETQSEFHHKKNN